MAIYIKTIEKIDGTSFKKSDRVIMGTLIALKNNGSPGALSSFAVNTAGVLTGQPTFTMTGNGTGATLVPNYKALTAIAAAAGSGYAPADTITLTGGTITTAAIATVTNTKLVSVAKNAGGSGYVVGDVITLAGGTATTAAQITVTGVTTGAVNTFIISRPGVYTANSATFTQGSTSGVGTGATFQTGLFGVNVASVSTAGSYTAIPTSPVAQGSTSGSGTGATFTMTWGLLSITVSAGGSGYDASSVAKFTGANVTTAPTTTITLGSTTGNAENLAVTLPLTANLTSNYGVWVNPKQACFASVADNTKTSNTFTVKLTPLSGGTISAGTIDVLIMA